MLRRQFLHLTSGAAAFISGISTTNLSARKTTQPSNTPKPKKPKQVDTNVLIIGGGPAGISAALELAERGIQVTIIEAGEQLGGKVKAWKETLDGQDVVVEHGIHGWWYQYVHFAELLNRYNLGGAIRPFTDEETGIRTPKGIIHSKFRLVEAVIDRIRKTGYRKEIRNWIDGFTDNPSALPSKIYERIGGKSVTQWIREGAPISVYTTFAEMLSWSMYFLSPKELDAATFALGERFYFNGSVNNDQVRWLDSDPQQALWNPLSKALKELGGEIRLASPAFELLMENGRVNGAKIGSLPLSLEVETPITQWKRYEVNSIPVFVGPGSKGKPVAFLGQCTHAGCFLKLGKSEFVCPCHGGRFSLKGEVTNGPPKRPLAELNTKQVGNRLQISGHGSIEEIRADYVILAVDAPAMAKLATPILPKVQGLKGRGEVVARFWLDRDVDTTARPAIIVDGYQHTSNAFLVHRLQHWAKQWADKTGGSVIELQAFRNLPTRASRDELLDLLEVDLRSIWAELKPAKVIKRSLTMDKTFTRFYPGWRDSAVPVDPGIPGLLVAGDHVIIERECQFMELAVLTGRMAANQILASTGLSQAKILPNRA